MARASEPHMRVSEKDIFVHTLYTLIVSHTITEVGNCLAVYLNGYIIKTRVRGDGRCGAGTGSRLPQPAGRYTCQGNWTVYKVKIWALPGKRHPNSHQDPRSGPECGAAPHRMPPCVGYLPTEPQRGEAKTLPPHSPADDMNRVCDYVPHGHPYH